MSETKQLTWKYSKYKTVDLKLNRKDSILINIL